MRINAGGARDFDSRNNSISVAKEAVANRSRLLKTRAAVLEGLERLLTTGATGLEVPERLVTTGAT